MESAVAGQLTPSGFVHLPRASGKQERNDGYRHPSNVNSWSSPYNLFNISRVSLPSSNTSVRCCTLDWWSSSWCKSQTVNCLRNMYAQSRNSLASREGSLRPVEERSCVGSPFGAYRKFRSQLDDHAILLLENVRSSDIITRKRSKGSSSVGLLLSHPLRQKRRSSCVCHADNGGTSGNSSELPAQNDKSLAEGGGSSASELERLITCLKQVDWMNFIFRWQKDEPLWTVPWTGQTIFQVMVLWFAAFWIMGSWIIPIAAQLAGFSRHSLSFRGQALYSLITDIAEGTVGIWILKRCLARFIPLPEGWFPINLKGKWLLEACWGCLLFPLVNRLSQLNLFLLPLPTPLTTTYVEQSMMSRDPIATLLYAVVISICAPVWEEVIFRGFLLPSMTRYLPLWGAISVSALAFALAHFSMQRILPLTFLGLVMGFVFVRSRNLLASIVLHSLWNGFAFLELL